MRGQRTPRSTNGRTWGSSDRASRRAGSTSPKAIEEISAEYTGDKARYQAAVQPLVDWVYSLSEDQLGDGVAEAYIAACLAQ